MVQDPVQDGRGDHGIPEDLVPLGKTPVRGQDQCPFFIPPGDELKKKVSSVPVDRDITDLVYYQQLRLAIELQPLLDPVLRVGLGQGSDERHGLGEVGPVAFGDGLDAQGHGQVSLAYAWRAQEDDVLTIGDEPALRELLDPLLVDRGLEGEVEALEGLT